MIPDGGRSNDRDCRSDSSGLIRMKEPQFIVTLSYVIAPNFERILNPHFSQGFYCGVTEDHV
jgi:hypothetical protein